MALSVKARSIIKESSSLNTPWKETQRGTSVHFCRANQTVFLSFMLRHKHNFFYKQAASFWTFIIKRDTFFFNCWNFNNLLDFTNCVGISADQQSVQFNSQFICASRFNNLKFVSNFYQFFNIFFFIITLSTKLLSSFLQCSLRFFFSSSYYISLMFSTFVV